MVTLLDVRGDVGAGLHYSLASMRERMLLLLLLMLSTLDSPLLDLPLSLVLTLLLFVTGSLYLLFPCLLPDIMTAILP